MLYIVFTVDFSFAYILEPKELILLQFRVLLLLIFVSYLEGSWLEWWAWCYLGLVLGLFTSVAPSWCRDRTSKEATVTPHPSKTVTNVYVVAPREGNTVSLNTQRNRKLVPYTGLLVGHEMRAFLMNFRRICVILLKLDYFSEADNRRSVLRGAHWRPFKVEIIFPLATNKSQKLIVCCTPATNNIWGKSNGSFQITSSISVSSFAGYV